MSIYNPAPLFVSTHTAYRTISEVILDLQINWPTADRVESGSIAQGKTVCSGTITSSTATLTFQGCSYYPVLAQFSRTVTIPLTGDLAEYEENGIYLVIRRPDVPVQVTDIEVEPYLVMYPDTQTTIAPKRRNFNGLHYSLEGLSAAFNQIRNADFVWDCVFYLYDVAATDNYPMVRSDSSLVTGMASHNDDRLYAFRFYHPFLENVERLSIGDHFAYNQNDSSYTNCFTGGSISYGAPIHMRCIRESNRETGTVKLYFNDVLATELRGTVVSLPTDFAFYADSDLEFQSMFITNTFLQRTWMMPNDIIWEVAPESVVLPTQLNSSDSVQITANETVISVSASAPLVVLPTAERKAGIRWINGLKPVNGDVSISGLSNMQIIVGAPNNA